MPYYQAFINAYPTVNHLAAAGDEEVFRLWQGLGYYNRCKNLLFTARYIAGELNGVFPATYEELIQLKGVGAYTASAIASFAYGLPHAVVDGNVYRVLARYLGLDTPYDTPEGKSIFTAYAQRLLHLEDTAAYNQAIMDFGATICTPQSYDCPRCPLRPKCFAYKRDMAGMLPVRSKKTAVQRRYFHYILFTSGDKIWIRKRTGKDIWQNLYELFLVEHTGQLDLQGLTSHAACAQLQLKNIRPVYDGNFTQRLTHRIIDTRFFSIDIPDAALLSEYKGIWVKPTELKNFGFPKTIVSFLEKKLYF